VVSMHDITERKKTEGMLREAYSNLENKVEQRTAELKVANARLEKKISEHEAAQETIRFKSVQLRERNKELNCHYVISQLAEQKERDLDGLLQGVIEALPVSYMYPGVACARLTMREKHYLSGAFAPTRWRQAQSITVNNQKVGEIEVFYLVEKPETDEGPFLKEERILINAVAERVGRFIEHDESEKKRREAEKSREQLIQTLQEKLEEINTLKGILPMCSFCKNIRDDKGNWELLEEYVSKYTQADVSHGICPECAQKHYPNMEFDSLDERKKTVPESQE
jgi:hypothetical protein